MSPVRDNIIRPLLCVEREEIEAWLTEPGHRLADGQYESDHGLHPEPDPGRYPEDGPGTDQREGGPGMWPRQPRSWARWSSIWSGRRMRPTRLAVREEDDARFVFANAFSREETLIGGRVLRRCMAELGGLKDVERVHIEQIRELMEKQTGQPDRPAKWPQRQTGIRGRADQPRREAGAAAGQPCIDLPGDSGQRPDSGADMGIYPVGSGKN